MDALDVERKTLIEDSKAKADGFEEKRSDQFEDCKFRLGNEYRRIREELSNR